MSRWCSRHEEHNFRSFMAVCGCVFFLFRYSRVALIWHSCIYKQLLNHKKGKSGCCLITSLITSLNAINHLGSVLPKHLPKSWTFTHNLWGLRKNLNSLIKATDLHLWDILFQWYKWTLIFIFKAERVVSDFKQSKIRFKKSGKK